VEIRPTNRFFYNHSVPQTKSNAQTGICNAGAIRENPTANLVASDGAIY